MPISGNAGVLRLRSRFASRNGYCAQDDNLSFDLNATCSERLSFFRELSPPAMARIRSSLALDTPSLLANCVGVFSANLICTFFGTVILQLSWTPMNRFPSLGSGAFPINKGGLVAAFENFPKQKRLGSHITTQVSLSFDSMSSPNAPS